jgi:hypothetical protein
LANLDIAMQIDKVLDIGNRSGGQSIVGKSNFKDKIA